MNRTSRRWRWTRFDVAVWLVAVLALLATWGLTLLQPTSAKAVAYLHPIRGGIQNIWVTPYDNPEDARQVTFSTGGIYNFGVSPDGRFIAYAERDTETNLTDLWMLDLRTMQTRPLTNCIAEDADCKTPVFNEAGTAIAYERTSLNPGLNVGPGAIRIWLLDLTQQPYTTAPLADDGQFIGHSPQWSQDGTSIAFYSADLASPNIIVYTFAPLEGERTLKAIQSEHGTVGSLSPNGRLLIFPELTYRADGIYTYLRLADLETRTFVDLTEANGENDDPYVAWHPDGQRAVIGRRYTDNRYTPGYQLYIMDVESKRVAPLVVDRRYSHGFFSWDKTGDYLTMQRFPLENADGSPAIDASPEIWVLELATGQLKRMATDAFFPRWVHGG